LSRNATFWRKQLLASTAGEAAKADLLFSSASATDFLSVVQSWQYQIEVYQPVHDYNKEPISLTLTGLNPGEYLNQALEAA
jgi:hypothetical protein